MRRDVCEASKGQSERQPSYPLLVLHSLISVPPLLTLHSDLRSVLWSGLGGCPNSGAHPLPCSSGLSTIKERGLASCLGLESTVVGFSVDESCVCRFARCTDPDMAIESRAEEIRPEDFLERGVGGGRRPLHSLMAWAVDSASDDGKTRSKGTFCPSFLRSLSIFCLRRPLKDANLLRREKSSSGRQAI